MCDTVLHVRGTCTFHAAQLTPHTPAEIHRTVREPSVAAKGRDGNGKTSKLKGGGCASKTGAMGK